MYGKLYVVATPIGNMRDITIRAVETLRQVDMIAAEDTQVTRKLLSMLQIKCDLISNHKFNERNRAEPLIKELMKGKNIAVVSDAGTPCISDPGSILINAAIQAGLEVVGVCGASAGIIALSISGFPITSFTFGGFLPREENEKSAYIYKLLKSEPSVLVFYESPRRILKTCELIGKILPAAQLCLCNDLTKKYERVYRGVPADVYRQLTNNESYEKGEYTLLIQRTWDQGEKETVDEAYAPEAVIVDYMVKQSCNIKEAIQGLAGNASGVSRNELYRASLRLKEIFAKG